MLKNNKKPKFKNFLKRINSATLSSAIALSAGAALLGSKETDGITIQRVKAQQIQDYLESVGSQNRGLRYFNDNDSENQTRIMMDGNNYLKQGFYMNATSVRGTSTTNVTLQFRIPGYDTSNLKFYVLCKDKEVSAEVNECTLSSSYSNPIPTIYLSELEDATYEVHVYNGSLAEENFVCKADFTCLPSYTGWSSTTSSTAGLLDGSGAPVKDSTGADLNLTYATPDDITTGRQFFLVLPESVIPYYASTVKVVFFAATREDKSIDIGSTLYDYVYKGTVSGLTANTNYVSFAPDALWGTDANTEYEAHFYVDEVKEGNFICKATGITNS